MNTVTETLLACSKEITETPNVTQSGKVSYIKASKKLTSV